MAVAAAVGGVSPNFDKVYSDIGKISKKLSIASPREFNDPGQTLKLSIDDGQTTPKEYDTYIRAFYGAEGSAVTYKLFYKDDNNKEVMVSDGTAVQVAAAGGAVPYSPPRVRLNGVQINAVANQRLFINPSNNGTIVWNNAVAGGFVSTSANNVSVGSIKLDAATGLDVALINERISNFNLVVEGLNKVLTVANNNIDTGVNMRL